jgi:hypothetical protein
VGCVIELCMSNCEAGVCGAVLMWSCPCGVRRAIGYVNVMCVIGILKQMYIPLVGDGR